MNKDFMQYVYARTEKALVQNSKYMKLQSKYCEAKKSNNDKLASDISDQMEAMAEELCYLQGFNDALRLVINI